MTSTSKHGWAGGVACVGVGLCVCVGGGGGLQGVFLALCYYGHVLIITIDTGQ